MRDFLIEDRSRLDSLDSLEASSWRAEYQRMVDNTPEICTEVDKTQSLHLHLRILTFNTPRFWTLTLTRFCTCLFVKVETGL